MLLTLQNPIRFIILILISTSSLAQEYWQQEVNYTIQARLDDKTHRITAFEKFEYINNSPDTLRELYIHLWPNAYRNTHTALAKQLYEHRNDALFLATEDEIGNIDSLDFKVNEQPVRWELTRENIDICLIKLSDPLLPGARIIVSTPFSVKIPSGKISRLGHIDQSYQITQWYPKPAVYDKNGWHPLPYLNYGEFYSEFGSYDVTLTLPANYIVGATGDLETASEITFLDSIAKKTKSALDAIVKNAKSNIYPPSANSWKTIRYTQSKVHDFAWFADKRFVVLKGEVKTPHTDNLVTTWAMFTPAHARLWKNAIEYLNDGIYYYSLWNGDYPYQQATAVDGTISAGGGMEYPNVTIIGMAEDAKTLELTIVHEVGHNWFYGILGSNERDHPWMDEGINSFNEMRYIKNKYPDNTMFSDLLNKLSFHFNDLDHQDQNDYFYRLIASLGIDQPISLTSKEYTLFNYQGSVYSKTALVFNYLKNYLGEERFDKAMQTYFDLWKYKHPQPDDLKTVLEQSTGENLNWMFTDLIETTNHLDYKLKQVKLNNQQALVTVKNVGQVPGPIEINAIKHGKVVESQWVEPGERKSTLPFSTVDADYFTIDANRNIPEINRNNNEWSSRQKLLKKFEKPKLEFGFGDHNPHQSMIHWLPAIGANTSDNLMLGMAFHNYTIPLNKFQYFVAPLYSFGRKNVSGIVDIGYVYLPKKTISYSKVGLNVKSFKNDYVNMQSEYYLFSPYWNIYLGNRRDKNEMSHNIYLQGMYRLEVRSPDEANFEQLGGFARYHLNVQKRDHQFNLKVRQDIFGTSDLLSAPLGRSSAEMSYSYRYNRRHRGAWMSFRTYFGAISSDADVVPTNYRLSLTGAAGYQDLFGENLFFGRNEANGLWSRQRLENMGQFKVASNFGMTDQYLATVNTYFQLPGLLRLFGMFIDAGAVQFNNKNYPVYDAGVALKLFNIKYLNVLSVYYTLWMNDTLADSFNSNDTFQRIRFSFSFNLEKEVRSIFR